MVEAQDDSLGNAIGSRLESLLWQLAAQGLEIGIRERVIAGRVAAGIVEQKSKLTADQWAFLLRARLTPVLAKSPEDAARIRRAFQNSFPQEPRSKRGQPVESVRPQPQPTLPETRQRRRFRMVASVVGLFVLVILVFAAIAISHWPSSAPAPVSPNSETPKPNLRQTTGPQAPNAVAATNTLTAEELGPLAKQIVTACANSRSVSIGYLAHRLAGVDPLGTDSRAMISLLQRYLPKAAGERFTLDESSLGFLVEALATRQYPGRTASAGELSKAIDSSAFKLIAAATAAPVESIAPPPSETIRISPLMAGLLLACPALVLAWWLWGRRARLKDYLRRRTPERPPLIHELIVHAADIAYQQTALTRAALRLGRSRDGSSRIINPEATANATAAAAGFPRIVFAPARSSPEYLALISTRGPQDHVGRQLDQLAQNLAAQNLALVRYFMAHDANLCFDPAGTRFLTIEQLARIYPDHRLIFFGTGDQLLNPGTFAVWPWAQEFVSWQRRAILTPKPLKEWGAPEAELARLFDGPPLQANTDGLLRMAELFERQDPAGGEHFEVAGNPQRWSWTAMPRRWLIPLPPDRHVFEQLESELARYFSDQVGNLDEDAFLWFASCAIYPALRWDLTVYLGLKLTSPRAHFAVPLYSEERALRLAVLPWFRDGFMPDWLRRRLIDRLPKQTRNQAAALLRDILDRAIKSETQETDALRLRIAQDRPDPVAAEPERDEVFLDALAGSNPLAIEVPRSFGELIRAAKNEFIRREWATVAVIAIYWAVTALIVLRLSSAALTTSQWLPLAFLPLIFVTWPAARRISRRATERTRRTRTANARD
jgi:hypothetical protein